MTKSLLSSKPFPLREVATKFVAPKSIAPESIASESIAPKSCYWFDFDLTNSSLIVEQQNPFNKLDTEAIRLYCFKIYKMIIV